MTITADTPHRAARRPVVAPSRAPRLGFPAPPPGGRRFGGPALVIAILLHLLVILLIVSVRPRSEYGDRAFIDPRALAPEDSLEIAFLMPIPPASAAEAPAPEPAFVDAGEERLVTPRVVPNFIPPVDPGAAVRQPAGEVRGARPGAGVAGGTAAGRLRQRVSDPRLWGAPAISSPLPKTPVDVVRERVADAIAPISDSIAEDAAARIRARDAWVYTDKEGRRWGVSPQGIFIGGRKVPMVDTLYIPPPAGRREEFEKRISIDKELAQQADRARVNATFKERAKAIRERKDRERAERQKEGSN